MAVKRGDARSREVESMHSTCSQTDSNGKERCASERWGACNAPVAKPIVVEGGDACQ